MTWQHQPQARAPAKANLTVILALEAVRRLNCARTLADRLAAIDFGRDQTIEANERADRIVERIMPRLSAPNGFADPSGFMDAARRNAQRGDLRKVIKERLLAKIVDRDELLLPAADVKYGSTSSPVATLLWRGEAKAGRVRRMVA